jgi:hypothetical protein
MRKPSLQQMVSCLVRVGGRGRTAWTGLGVGGEVAMKFKWKLLNSEWNVRTVIVSRSTQHGSIASEQNSNNMQEITEAKQNLN